VRRVIEQSIHDLVVWTHCLQPCGIALYFALYNVQCTEYSVQCLLTVLWTASCSPNIPRDTCTRTRRRTDSVTGWRCVASATNRVGHKLIGTVLRCVYAVSVLCLHWVYTVRCDMPADSGTPLVRRFCESKQRKNEWTSTPDCLECTHHSCATLHTDSRPAGSSEKWSSPETRISNVDENAPAHARQTASRASGGSAHVHVMTECTPSFG
jgi:hypothetical protein